jgi:hypothetical protein
MKSFLRRLLFALGVSLVVLSAGPLIWLVIAMILECARGGTPADPFLVRASRHDLYDKMLASLTISGFAAALVLVGILWEKVSPRRPTH